MTMAPSAAGVHPLVAREVGKGCKLGHDDDEGGMTLLKGGG
jgi:hypothetical protein